MKDPRHWGWDLLLACMWFVSAAAPPHTHPNIEIIEVVVSAFYVSKVVRKLTKRQKAKT